MSQQKTKLWSLLKTSSFLFIISLLISCSIAENKSIAVDVTQEFPLELDGQVPKAALSFQTNPTLLNFNAEEKEKLLHATEIIKRVVASHDFREGILNHTWKGKKQFADNMGLTNAQIYAKILHASETYLDKKNNTLDVELELFFEPTKTIGYTYPNTKRIWMNKKYYDTYSAIQVSDNLFHEWLHKIGFDHSTKWSKDRDHSVPYAIGYLVERIAYKMDMSQSHQRLGINN